MGKERMARGPFRRGVKGCWFLFLWREAARWAWEDRECVSIGSSGFVEGGWLKPADGWAEEAGLLVGGEGGCQYSTTRRAESKIEVWRVWIFMALPRGMCVGF